VEEMALEKSAATLLTIPPVALAKAEKAGAVTEVKCDA